MQQSTFPFSALAVLLALLTGELPAALVDEPPPAVESQVTSGQADIIEPLLAPDSDEHDVVAQHKNIERAGIRVPSIGDRVVQRIVNLPVFRTLFFEESKGTLYGGKHLLDEGEEGRVYVTEEGKPLVLNLSALAWVATGLIVVPVLIGIFISRLRAAKLRMQRLQKRHMESPGSRRRASRRGRRKSRSKRESASQPG